MDGSQSGADEFVEDFLEHFGVKGMKWGVRKKRESGQSGDSSSKGSEKKPKEKLSKLTDDKGRRLTKADAKWTGKAASFNKGMSAYNDTARTMNATHLPSINNNPKYKGKDLEKNAALRKEYNKEVEKAFTKEFNSNLQKVYGDSPSGRYKITSTATAANDYSPGWTISYTELKHGDYELIVVAKVKNGFVVGLSLKEALQHGLSDEEYLTHYGIRGMKWGVRRKRSSGPDPSDDKKSANAAASKVGKKGNTDALSNRELQSLVNRMNLEQQYTRLQGTSKRTNPGAKFAKEILLGVGKQQALKFANDYAAKQLAQQLAKK